MMDVRVKRRVVVVHNLEDPSVAIESSNGYSSMRLVPKETGDVRPIISHSCRVLVPMLTPAAHGAVRTKVLRLRINNLLAPVGQMLNLERELHPKRLESAIFSVDKIY